MVRRFLLSLAVLAAATVTGVAPADAGPATSQCPTTDGTHTGVKVPVSDTAVTVLVTDTRTGDAVDVDVTFTENDTSFALSAPASAAYTVTNASWCVKSSTVTTRPLYGTGTTGATPAANKRGSAQRIGYLTLYTVTTQAFAGVSLFSFESGPDGWAPGNWQQDAGTVAQSGTFATDGSHSLEVSTVGGGWFGATFDPQRDLSGSTRITLDLKTTNAGTSTTMALQLGDGWAWCQASWGWVDAGTTTTVEFDLAALGCLSPELDQVKSMYIWLNGGGVFYVDNVRAV